MPIGNKRVGLLLCKVAFKILKSRVKREFQARFRENVGVKFPCVTRLAGVLFQRRIIIVQLGNAIIVTKNELNERPPTNSNVVPCPGRFSPVKNNIILQGNKIMYERYSPKSHQMPGSVPSLIAYKQKNNKMKVRLYRPKI